MMADIFTSDDNSTPLTPEEKEGLKPRWITLRRELNEFETRNISEAETWLLSHRPKDVLNDFFCASYIKRCLEKFGSGLGNTGQQNVILVLFRIKSL